MTAQKKDLLLQKTRFSRKCGAGLPMLYEQPEDDEAAGVGEVETPLQSFSTPLPSTNHRHGRPNLPQTDIPDVSLSLSSGSEEADDSVDDQV